jgi:hypothetical protein
MSASSGGRRRVQCPVEARTSSRVCRRRSACSLEDEWGPDLEHVSGRPGRAEQYPAHRLGHRAGLICRRRQRLLVLDELDTEQQALAPHIPDESAAVSELRQAFPEATSTTSPPYRPTLLRKNAGHHPESYFRAPHDARARV